MEMDDETVVHEVERIVAHYPSKARNHKQVREYRVKYKGMPSWNNQKEPAFAIARDHIDLVRSYWANQHDWEPTTSDLPSVAEGDHACAACWSNESNQDDPGAPAMLLCDGCEKGFHTTCLVPPLTAVPPEHESWYCPQCRKPGDSRQRR
jgi:hypothetical protein